MSVLQFDNITKTFPGVKALNGVSFEARPGQVMGLLGENGAGKSTLLKILGGQYRPDGGRLLLDGRERHFGSAGDAIRAGVTIIHQELQYVAELTVAENVLLGRLPTRFSTRFGLVDHQAARKLVAEQLANIGVDLDPAARLSELSIAQRQMVEICKAVMQDARVIAFAGVLGAMVLERTGSVGLAIGGGLAAGALIGAFNGVLIAYLRVNALIATLATMLMVRGLAFIASQGQAVGIADEGFIGFGDTSWLGLPLPVWLTAGCFLVFGVLLNHTVFGRNTLAIGGNPEAARLAGVKVEQLRVWIFLLQGVVTALAGLVLASRITSGQPNAATGFELDVISACVLGGVSLQGGKARIFGVVIGVLIMGTVENVMNLLNVDAFYQYLVRGLILLAAVLLDQLKTRGERRA